MPGGRHRQPPGRIRCQGGPELFVCSLIASISIMKPRSRFGSPGEQESGGKASPTAVGKDEAAEGNASHDAGPHEGAEEAPRHPKQHTPRGPRAVGATPGCDSPYTASGQKHCHCHTNRLPQFNEPSCR